MPTNFVNNKLLMWGLLLTNFWLRILEDTDDLALSARSVPYRYYQNTLLGLPGIRTFVRVREASS